MVDAFQELSDFGVGFTSSKRQGLAVFSNAFRVILIQDRYEATVAYPPKGNPSVAQPTPKDVIPTISNLPSLSRR